ncbi:MAG: bifunctional (p)ppGpp synthetase/guanosine-3',5'-bis(diphosphate) 3'-pyrophosphohydrolase [Deltaproteobacteria bacterium]|nr:bifunctional (p)ppGpp synthetase/guanosine-3',5'-bis(diphosphate) 3'-pyrophosphohydrolase [Deltaproteobacteria bacterium]
MRLNDIIDKVLSYHPDVDIDLLKKAYVYSAKVHAGQVRKTGEPYLIHPLAVAGILADMQLDVASVCTGLLHDTVEDTLATLDDIKGLFGTDIAHLVDGVTKLSAISFQTSEEKQAENFRKMLVAMARDIRVLLVKLADRLHNMRTLDAMKPASQERIARETMEIYAPLANRLGISWLKIDLEDLSFLYLKPREHGELTEKLGQSHKERDKFIEDTTHEIISVLDDVRHKHFEVSGRPKHLWSVHKKMISKNIAFEEVHDLVAFRVLTEEIGECYETLGLVHAKWRPVPGRFKDYIAMPKPNGYKSLHTTVVGPDGHRIEIQIRTRDMHEVAEGGIAAHWKYKAQPNAPAPSGKEKDGDERRGEGFRWLRQLMDFQRDLKDPNEFLESVKFDLFSEEVFIFTPGGQVIELPHDATPVDFAYAIHTQVGNTCCGAKVNGRMVPLRHVFTSGDTCEIITKKGQAPSKDWLDFVRTSRARTRIRAHVRTLERERSMQIGQELVDKEFKRYGQSLAKALKEKGFEKGFAEGSKYKTSEDVFIAVGYGKLTPLHVVERILPDDIIKKDPVEPKRRSRLSQLIDRVARRSASGVKIEGIEDMLVHYARCCSPVKGDPIVGFVTRGRGLTIHRHDCSKVLQLDPERRLKVVWDDQTTLSRPIMVRVTTDDRAGMLADLSAAFQRNSVSISEANCRAGANGQAVNIFKCGILDLNQLRKVVKALEGVPGVHSVERARPGEL